MELAAERSLYLIIHSDFYLLLISLLVLDVPRYLFSTISYCFLFYRGQNNKKYYKPNISVVMSLLNAESSFERIIANLHNQTIKPFEIIVIDDGSTDRTKFIAENALRCGQIDILIHHKNCCGKAASINHGVRFAKGELVLSIDDDTFISPDGIEKLAAVFEDPSIGIASGNIPIRNKDDSIWTSLQALEYMISIEVGRSVLDLFDAVSCCSGAFSMFRRDVFTSIGGHNISSAEDLELTLRMRELGYKARFVSNAIATVDAPITLESLLKQRNRWDFNNLKLRLLMNKDYYIFKSGESLSNALARADFMLCDFIPTISFPFYLVWLYWYIGDLTITYLFTIYVLLLIIYITNIAICLITTRQNFSLASAAVAPIFPFYIGIILKIMRFVTYSNEILYSISFHDTHIPLRIRKALFGDIDH